MGGTDVAADRCASQSSPLFEEPPKSCAGGGQRGTGRGNTPPAASRTDPGMKSEAAFQPYRMEKNAS
jgi:hypothetical protein